MPPSLWFIVGANDNPVSLYKKTSPRKKYRLPALDSKAFSPVCSEFQIRADHALTDLKMIKKIYEKNDQPNFGRELSLANVHCATSYTSHEKFSEDLMTLSLEAEVDVAADEAAVEVAVDADKAVGRLLAPARHNERQLRDDELVAGRQVGGAPVRQEVGRARGVVDVGGVAVGGELHQLVAGPGRLLLAPGVGKNPGFFFNPALWFFFCFFFGFFCFFGFLYICPEERVFKVFQFQE
jgi:hypothetical protein